MSWLYSRVLVEAYLEDSCLAGEQSAPLRLNPMPQAFLSKGRMTAFSRLSRFGMTFGLLTEDLGAVLLMWYQADSPVPILAVPAKEQDLKENKVDSGQSLQGSLAKYDPATHSLRTHQCSLFGGGYELLQTLPKWGSTVDGALYQQQTPEHLTCENESGLWRSPSAREPGVKAERLIPIEGGQPGGMNRHFDKHTGRMAQIGLIQQVRLRELWPTPRANKTTDENQESWQKRKDAGKVSTPPLTLAVKMWPTPTAQDAKNNGSPSQVKRNTKPLNAVIGGSLNPTWVEWLMGWPLGWTDLKPLEMGKFQEWQRSHGEYYQENNK